VLKTLQTKGEISCSNNEKEVYHFNSSSITEIKEATDIKPNITIRNNQNVYVTINYFNESEKEYSKGDNENV